MLIRIAKGDIFQDADKFIFHTEDGVVVVPADDAIVPDALMEQFKKYSTLKPRVARVSPPPYDAENPQTSWANLRDFYVRLFKDGHANGAKVLVVPALGVEGEGGGAYPLASAATAAISAAEEFLAHDTLTEVVFVLKHTATFNAYSYANAQRVGLGAAHIRLGPFADY